MSRILVTPEMLLRVAEQCSRAHEQLEAMIYMLNQNIHMLESAWEGTTRSRFYADFQQAHREMTQTTEHIHRTSLELRGIAQRFKSADERVQPIQVAGHVLGTFPMMRGPAGYGAVEDMGRKAEEAWNSVQQEAGKAWDTVKQEAGELWEGVKIGAAQLGNSLKDTGISLYEDPLGTGKEMLYNATIGTVEEIWNTGMWAGRMVFSNEYREKVAEDVKAEVDSAGGWSNYLGQAAALIVGEVVLNRAGIRGRGPLNKKHDDRGGGNSGGSGNGGGNGGGGGNDSGNRGGDGEDGDGNKSGDEGTGKVELSLGNIKHFWKGHSFESFSKQIPYLLKVKSREAVEQQLSNVSFFNKNLSKDQVVSQVERASNEAVAKGITHGRYSTIIDGELITVAFDNGLFQSAWGSHKYKISDFGY
ncbi:WXG100 family type VII secretion target [Paenibacillus ihbetae]|uniref:WXG100 family type VII secretion target n=1 Tax=Paenibacillus ihbetae TaxID=1870820 RepID=UPI001CB899C4|nr:WXG100 family type VII secretion target [Paenibacillus ihbetae]